MNDHTPPPLVHSPTASSDRGRASTAESTPVTTPVDTVATTFNHVSRAKRAKDRDLYFSWHKRSADPGSAVLDSDILFEEDSGDSSFPLFPASPALGAADDMDGAAQPLDITTPPRFNSQSPRTQQSNLTSALQEAGAQGDYASPVPVQAQNGLDVKPAPPGRQNSISNGVNSSSYYNRSAINIPDGRGKSRRESAAGAGSFINGGMSWGGVSVGSWVRDDILMTGTSPYAFHQSPSFHSSSYLPKMEANFLKDYSCCGITLDSLHELLQHYEENHAQPSNIVGSAAPQLQGANGRQTSGIGGQAAGMPNSQQFGVGQSQMQLPQQPKNSRLQPLPDVDELGDMEMDDTAAPMTPMQQSFNYQSQPQTFNHQQQPQLQPLNMNLTNTMQNHHGMRSATPTTPSANFNFANNPTVSSVNTPALSTQQMASGAQQKSPDTSVPGTPQGEFDPNTFNFDPTSMANMPLMPDMNMMQNPNFDWASMGAQNFGGLPSDMSGLTIDDPAKHLFSKQGAQGGGLTAQQLQYMLRTGQLGDNTDLAKAVQQQLQGRLGGLGLEQENKPFKCPVIGCEKAYKNQNGLKYHKQHGHQNQQLKSNPDGTFSIVDPLTSAPYPGTMGMEKEKPYRCEVCGKRYKNLNGLKYHRQHSPPCNPDLKLNMPNLAGLNVNVNVAGAGLPVGDLAAGVGAFGGGGGGLGGF